VSHRVRRSAARTGSRTAAHRPQLWLYATGALLWASGLGWLASHYLVSSRDDFGELSHPWDAVWLPLHGAAMMAFLVALGALLPTHIVPVWRRRTNRRSGLVMLVVVAVLALTGYGLYYAGDEQLRPWISAIHWGVGLCAAVALLAHRVLGKRRQATRAATRALPEARASARLASPAEGG
jgi:cation transport ATPase